MANKKTSENSGNELLDVLKEILADNTKILENQEEIKALLNEGKMPIVKFQRI